LENPLQVSSDKVVLIHYTLKDDAGTVVDASDGSEPLAYIHGHGNLVPGLEKALEGQEKGSKIAVSVPPEEGYGKHDAKLIQRVPKRSMQSAGQIKKGMQFQGRTEDGMRVFTVTALVGDMVTLDGNHPLADKTLHFAVEVVEVRDATTEELEHGHVHGAGGHHH
jgi:FKBP-type peptidyl-prolyl cis-trans isomerase SlyD